MNTNIGHDVGNLDPGLGRAQTFFFTNYWPRYILKLSLILK